MDEILSKNRGSKSAITVTKTCRAGGPVRCVSLPTGSESVNSWMLWGLGPFLRRECKASSTKLLVFSEQEGGGCVHGISYLGADLQGSSSWDAVVYGRHQLAICKVLDAQDGMKRLDVIQQGATSDDSTIASHMTVADWLWNVQLMSNPDNSDVVTMVLGMARHFVEIWNVTRDSKDNAVTATFQRRINGSPAVLVTAMTILPQVKTDNLWIAAGTAFQEIRIWSMKSTGEFEKGHKLHTLQGHAGAIHSLQFASNGHSLVSTSDDRSVRYWCYNAEQEAWQQKWVAWGHTARVWNAALSSQAVVSVAEDGTIRSWCRETGTLRTCIQHPYSLWSICIQNEIAVVGSTDGTVAVYNLYRREQGKGLLVLDDIPIPDDRPRADEGKQYKSAESEQQNDSILGTNTAIDKPAKAPKIASQVIVGLKWFTPSELLLATREGSLMTFDVSARKWNRLGDWWEENLQNSHGIETKSGCHMAVSTEWIAIGTTTGDIVLKPLAPNAPNKCIFSAKQLKSVQGLKWVGGNILVSFHVRSVAIWGANGNQLVSTDQPTWILNMNTKGVPTCCDFNGSFDRVVVGDSRGNIALFVIAHECETSCIIEPTSVLLRVHQKEHVKDIKMEKSRILSVGNDGSLCISYMSHGNTIQNGWSMPISSITGVNRLWLHSLNDGTKQCTVSGYYGNQYRLLNASSGQELFSMDTGGRQRLQDFQLDLVDDCPDLCRMAVCMNQKEGTNTLSVRQELPTRQKGDLSWSSTLQGGTSLHGETIFDTCFVTLGITDSVHFLLTGSEDCGSKISRCEDGALVSSMLLTPQESCVRAVCCSQHDRSSALLVIGGGKLVLQFFLATAPPANEPKGFLNDAKVCFLGKTVSKRNVSIDHRINAVKAIPLLGSKRLHLVVAGDSDGNCHLYCATEEAKVGQGILIEVSSRPILCLDMCSIGNAILVAIGTTGGDVLLYSLPREENSVQPQWTQFKATLSPLLMLPVHQLGTNTISMTAAPSLGGIFSVEIMSGGDDQALATIGLGVMVSPDGKVTIVDKQNLEVVTGASFSAIKGVTQITRWGDNKYCITTGYSQYLALWQLSEKIDPTLAASERQSIKLLQSVPVDIGDVNCLATCCTSQQEALVAVGGLGVEVFVLKNS